MKTRRIFILVIIVLGALTLLNTGLIWAGKSRTLAPASPQAPLGTGFTYQGYLTEGDVPAEGAYDFNFDLYPHPSDPGTPIGTVLLEDVPVAGGIFTAALDFGAGAFNGEARWLEIGVRPGGETGAFTPLGARQPVNPSPYALYALEAGGVDWSGVANRPAGLDDGDDDTQYEAGFGLELDGNTFNALSSSLQRRVYSGCAVGSTIRKILEDGTVVCQADAPLNRNQPPRDNDFKSFYTDSYGPSSITIGSDGLPVISLNDVTEDLLKVIHCGDPACQTAEVHIIGDCGIWGLYNDIAIGADGNPIISYFDDTEKNFKVAHCFDPECTGSEIFLIDSELETCWYNAIAIGVNSLPVISYVDGTNAYLKFAYCEEPDCSSAVVSTLVSSENVNYDTSIAIGTDGLPIISYGETYGGVLNALHCEDIACTSFSIQTIESFGLDQFQDLTIGVDGLPVIGYYYYGGNLKAAHCLDRECTSVISTTLDTAGNVGFYVSIYIGADGLPILSYEDYDNETLKFAHCDDIACSSASTIILDESASVGRASSLTIGADGLPIITYMDYPNYKLKVVHCSNPFCIPYWRR